MKDKLYLNKVISIYQNRHITVYNDPHHLYFRDDLFISCCQL